MKASPDLQLPVFHVVEELQRELRPHQRVQVRSGSTLDRELGFDSLARVELLTRLERTFGVQLPPRVAVEAETVADLIRALEAATPGTAGPALRPLTIPERREAEELPTQAETLIEVLDWHAERHPERHQVWLMDDADQVQELSYGDFQAGAERVAWGLNSRGIEPGQAVALMFPTGEEFFHAFFGALLAGAVPVPLYPPARPNQLEDHLRRQAGILRRAEARLMLTVPEAKRLGLFLESQVPSLQGLVTVPELASGERLRSRPQVGPDDTAFLQFTSGSTGNPKGVVLTHRNLLANVRVIGEFVAPQPEDVFVSWLPLYHDMGLIGAVFATFYHAVPLVLMSPLAFLVRPERWLQAIHRHRGTLSAAPNFAYALSARKVPEELLGELDLSCWRMTLNGAESISPRAMSVFAERFAGCGFRPEAMTPTYGLAECSLALAMTPLTRAPLIDRISRAIFASRGRAEPLEDGAGDALAFVSCGAPLRGHEIRIVDPNGRELAERREGRLQFRGPSATQGYFRDPEATAKLLTPDGWLDSGDLAYVAQGEVFLTGRVKDVIIRAGRNVYPHELEEAVGELPGVRKGCVAVFAARDETAETEKLVVLAETREGAGPAQDALRGEIQALTQDLLGTPADDVVLAPPRTVLKTSSGKVRRAACRELYEQGRLGQASRAVWLQLLRLSVAGWGYGLLQRGQRLGELAYAAYFWGLFVVHLTTAWLGVVLLPSRSWRWGLARTVARSFLFFSGLTPRRTGQTRLGSSLPRVLVSNHASYLDGIVMAATLPGVWAPVVKSSLRDQKIMGTFLRRLGALFVERFDRQSSAADAGQLPEALARGVPVLVFPEGTCLRLTGLLPFHMGAFMAAAQAGVPLVPLTIRGTRNVLRPDTWFPRRGQVEVLVGAPLQPEGSGWEAAVTLRDGAREWILASCAEPDLGREDAARYLQPTPHTTTGSS